MDAGDVDILRKFNDETNRRILNLNVPDSREVSNIAINALADGRNVYGALRRSQFSLNYSQANTVWVGLKSALKARKVKMMAVRQK